MPTFGESLRRERELRQITLREISESTKINLRYLDSLEKDDFRHLPGGVFNKGFVRAYAQYIGVDPDHMVDAYLAEEARQATRTQERAEAAQVRLGQRPLPGDTDARSRSDDATRWVRVAALVVALVLIAIAGGLTWLGRGTIASWWRSHRPPYTSPSAPTMPPADDPSTPPKPESPS